MMKAQFAIALALMVVGCGPSGGGDDTNGDAVASLTVDPPSTELLIDNGTPANADFTAMLTYPDGHTRDVTGEVRFSIDEGYGTFNANHLTVGTAGKTSVFATWSDKSASAEVIVRLRSIRIDPSLPANAADWFNGPDDPARAPEVVYPADNVVMPRNIGEFEVHWNNNGNDVFEVSVTTEFTDVRAIVPGGNGKPINSSWTELLPDEWTAAVGNESTVMYRVRGVDSTNPINVGTAPLRLVKLSNEQMLGGMYYWASQSHDNGAYGIFRHDMSKPGQPAEEYLTSSTTGGRCVACHVLSRDGTKMSVTYDRGNGSATFVDVATKAAQTETRGWNFGAFTPDGNKFLAVQNGTLTVLDYATQTQLATMTAAGAITHPDLSADGTKLVYVQSPGGSDWDFSGGKIFWRTFGSATNTFGPEQMLISDSDNNYYPSFSPDGQWVLFNRSPSGSAYNNVNATLWVVKADGSTPPIQLEAAASGMGQTNSWGRWAPFQQSLGTQSEPMYWITVSSTRDFGVRLVNDQRPQVWMTPFFPQRAAQSQDPSASAFRLPFQNIESNNHIAQWTEQIIAVQ